MVDPVTAKIAMHLGLSVVKSRAARRLVIATALIGALAGVLVMVAPLYLSTMIFQAVQMQPRQTETVSNCPAIASTETDTSPVPAVGQLSEAQVRVARTIYAATLGVGQRQHWATATTERAYLVAVSVAAQESSLGASSSASRPNAQGDAGVFQQRTLPGWYGTLDQVNDVAYATETFLTGKKITENAVKAARANHTRPAGPAGYIIPGLMQVPGWQEMSITQAAQLVQRSAFPDAYAKWEPLSRTLLAVFKGHVDPASSAAVAASSTALCGPLNAMTCPPSGSPAEAGLTPDALRVIRCVKQTFPKITLFGGVGDRPAQYDDDHAQGRAVDVMLPTPYASSTNQDLGHTIAEWAVKNRQALGVKYVIFNAKIWSVAHASEGWRQCGHPASCYSGPDDTQAHRDHVHISVFGDSAGDQATSVVGDGTTVLPVSNYVLTGRFGQCGSHWAHCHTGLDFAAPTGTPIHAVQGGTVTYAANCGCAYGNLTKVKVSSTVELWYAHQSRIEVTVGEKVKAGQEIGKVGATGNVTGPHVHLERRVSGTPTDPEAWLKSLGVLKHD